MQFIIFYPDTTELFIVWRPQSSVLYKPTVAKNDWKHKYTPVPFSYYKNMPFLILFLITLTSFIFLRR